MHSLLEVECISAFMEFFHVSYSLLPFLKVVHTKSIMSHTYPWLMGGSGTYSAGHSPPSVHCIL